MVRGRCPNCGGKAKFGIEIELKEPKSLLRGNFVQGGLNYGKGF